MTVPPSDKRKFPYWAIKILEGVGVVVSILIAFGIDAWWDRQNEAEEARGVLEDYRSLSGDARLAKNDREIAAHRAKILSRLL